MGGESPLGGLRRGRASAGRDLGGRGLGRQGAGRRDFGRPRADSGGPRQALCRGGGALVGYVTGGRGFCGLSGGGGASAGRFLGGAVLRRAARGQGVRGRPRVREAERDQKEERTPEWMRPKLGTSEGGVGTVWLWGTEDNVEEAWREQVQGGTVSGQRPRDGGLGGTRPAAGSRG